MGLLFEDKKTVNCIKAGLSLDEIKTILERAADGFATSSVKTVPYEDSGTATIEIRTIFIPQPLEDSIFERIASATPLYARTALKCFLADREAAESGRLGTSWAFLQVLELAEDHTVFEYDLDSLDYEPLFLPTSAAGYPVLSMHAAAAGINLEYQPEPILTLRAAIKALESNARSWEKVSRKQYEDDANRRIAAAEAEEERKRREKQERRAKLVAAAKSAIVDGVLKGKYASKNEAEADLDFASDIISLAWRQTAEERAKAYWRCHSEERSEIESEIDQLKSKIESSKSLETSLREKLASLTGFFKGGKRREVTAEIEAETAKREKMEQRIEMLASRFETMPEW